MVVIGKTQQDLQNSLNALYDYCCYWGLEVNTSKTKVVVFRKRGPIKMSEKWYYNNEPLEVVNDFNYLGVVFNYTGSFVLNNQCIIGKSLKAMYVLLKNINKLNVTPTVSLQLFDSFVGSILNYACPVWGFSKSKDLERVHLKFCKIILGVKQSACNDAIYGELGRYPLYINRFVHIIKYWFKLLNTDNIILQCIYQNAVEQCNLKGVKNWAYKVKVILNEYGFADVWNFPGQFEVKSFVPVFKQRIIDCFKQKWFTDIAANNVLNTLYVYIKTNFGMENYLNMLYCKSSRICLTKLRISSHKLRIEFARYGRERLERNERLCQLCDINEIEDEFHFVLKCKVFKELRIRYIKKYYYTHTSMYKFIELLQSKNKSVLINLCKYITTADKKRNELMQTI